MARRASSSINPLWLIGAVVAIAIAVGAVLLFKNTVGDPYRTLTVFPLKEYMDNSNSLRGNTYRLDCVIEDQLAFNPQGRAYEVLVSGEPLSLVVPPDLKEVNIQKGQRFLFKVEVGDKGVVRVVEAKKA
jgi:hypothetical protein